jgi:putative transposase
MNASEWMLIAPLIPPARRGGRPRDVNQPEILNAIFCVLATGCQWQALPKDQSPKSTAHHYFLLWDWDGTLERNPRNALCRGSRGGWTRSEPNSRDHRQPDRQGGSKRGSALDPQGYDAGKSAPRRRVSAMEEDSIQKVVD